MKTYCNSSEDIKERFGRDLECEEKHRKSYEEEIKRNWYAEYGDKDLQGTEERKLLDICTDWRDL